MALAETIRLMREIDQAIEDHGGWPSAFTGGGRSAATVDRAGPLVASTTPEARDPQAALFVDDGEASEVEASTKKIDGTSSSQESTASKAGTAPSTKQIDTDDLISSVRQIFANGRVRDRESAIAGLASEFGFERVGSRIRETFDNGLRTAVRRGVLANTNEGLQLESRSVEDHDRTFLKQQFLASLEGRGWREREDAARRFARWLGFRRTGPTISDSVRSLVNGLIREGRLEDEGSLIRRTGN